MLDTGSRPSFTLTSAEAERLSSRLNLALRRARRSGSQTLATISVIVPGEVDPTAVVCASRHAGEQWFAFEQPDRGRAALAGLGEAIRLQATGPERFTTVAARWRELSAAAVCDSEDDASGSEDGGPVAVGGFAFAPDGGAAPHWAGFEPASLIVPELTLKRAERGGVPCVRLTLTALVSPDDVPEELLARLQLRLSELRGSRCRCWTRRRPVAFRLRAQCPPSTMRLRSHERWN